MGYVLRSFRAKETEAVWQRRRTPKLDLSLQRAAWRKLAMLDAAETLSDLRVPPGNRLEKLAGDRGSVQHPDQPAVADLLPVGRRRARGRRDH